MLYPQTDEFIVATDSVTSIHPMYIEISKCSRIFTNIKTANEYCLFIILHILTEYICAKTTQ